ncbi:MAG: hypothetical protein OXL98_05140, partial [Acidimicrobiaceae bacterium]|nr:hypothetical protein [Acidimicrobiaceae bacterium]
MPEELADEFSLVGPVGRSRERPQAPEESPARTLNGAARFEQECRQAVEFVKGGGHRGRPVRRQRGRAGRR